MSHFLSRPPFTGLLMLSLLAGCSSAGGSYPSLLPRPGEVPRQIEAKTVAEPATLSEDDSRQLQADLARERNTLARILAEAGTAHSALQREMTKAGKAATGSKLWSDAQSSLSRFNLTWEPLRQIGTDMVPMTILVGDLAEDDPNRQQVQALQQDVDRAITRNREISDRAAQQLNR